MSNFTDDIRRIAKQKEDNDGLGNPIPRASMLGITEDMVYKDGADYAFKIVPPLTFEVLTYDDTKDVDIEANNGDFTIKTAMTAQIVDAVGQVFEIDEIIYATP